MANQTSKDGVSRGKGRPASASEAELGEIKTRTILDNVREVVFRVDPDVRWTYLNRAWETVSGHACEASLGRAVAEFIHPEDRLLLAEIIRRLHAHPGEPATGQLRCVRPNGGLRWLDVSCRCASWGRGDFEAFGTLTDVTEQREVARTLEAQRAFLRNVIDSDPNIIFVKDVSGVFRLANKALAAFYGMTPEDLVGRSDAEVNSNADEVAYFREQDRTVIVTGTDFLSIEERLQSQSGPRWYQKVKRAITCPETGERQVLGFACDVTETMQNQRDLVAAREEALESSRLKSEFLANMSHEIRTPMNGVIGMADLLIDSELEPEQQAMARTIRESAESLLTILNDILDFSKIEAGKMSTESLPVDLADLLERVSVSFAQRAEAKGLGFEIDIDWRQRWTYATDPVRLRQVLNNLISNAVKFTDDGEVRVSLELGSRGFPMIQVQDTGIGIARDQLGAVFGPFIQADGSVTRKHGGTGLGLAIAQQLASLLGGSITVQSEPGKGSRFSLELDVPHITASLSDERRLLGRRVAIVTDDPHVAMSGRGALLSLGAAVVPVDGEHDAVLFDARGGGEPPLGRIIALLGHGAQMPDGAAAAIYEPLTRRALIDAVVRAAGDRSHVALRPARARRSGRILLVEDNPVNQQVAVLQLEKEGLTVELASTGREAIQCTARYDYDLVIMDVQMPVMDGLEATRKIRERDDELGRHVPIVAMTAHAMKGDRERCLEAGMDDYLCKPLRREDLSERVAAWVDPSEVAGICELDEAYLLATFGEDRDFLADVLLTYVQSTDELVESLREALGKVDTDRMRTIAHTLKGSSRSIGAVKYAEQCELLEHGALSEEIERAANRLLNESPRMLAACRTRARRLRTPQHA